MRTKVDSRPVQSSFSRIWILPVLLLAFAAAAQAQNHNEPGILEPMTSAIQNKEIRIPNTDQSVDGDEQSLIHGDPVWHEAVQTTSLTGHPITHVASPNFDMRLALLDMVTTAQAGDGDAMRVAAQELKDILLGTTQGRIYDGFSMLNFNRWKHPEIGAEHFAADVVPGEYKMKVVRDSGDRFISPYDGEERKVWEVDVAMLYYDGQIDSDTFLVKFPFGVHDDDTLRVNYRIFSLVSEDFSPTMVMLDKRVALNTVQFPFKGLDSVWVAFFPGQVLDLSVDYTTARQVRGVYTWGWREHPPRIQFMQPIYEIRNAHTGEIELDPQGISFAYRNRENLTLDNIGRAAPEIKMYEVAIAALDGASPLTILKYMTDPGQGPRGTWADWADLAEFQRQVPDEAWDLLADEGITPGNLGDYKMVSVFLNNEMYGDGEFLNEIVGWKQGETFQVKLVNLDNHTHYFRNVDFSTRLHDDILRCCGGGQTSFEIMNFKPSYGAPKVAEMQWRAGWGFRPHYDVVQQDGVFPRGSDNVRTKPYTGGEGGTYFGYQYSEEARGGDFVFNPPPFIIGFDFANPSSDLLREADGSAGLVIGQFTEGYGDANMCAGDPWPGFCQSDIQLWNPHGVKNFPPPPLRGQPVFPEDVGKFPGDVYPDQAVELRFPPFLRNPTQGVAGAGDIIPPTGAWRPFLWTNPHNGTLFIDADDPSKGYWADLTFSHGAPVFANATLSATVELPRASGQVFYQFDDLFHDNSIFSPHPLFEGESVFDSVRQVRATVRDGALSLKGRLGQLRGRVSEEPTGEFASWVTVQIGTAEDGSCTGALLAALPVSQTNGRFVLRQNDAAVAPGSTLCVSSSVGSLAELVVE